MPAECQPLRKLAAPPSPTKPVAKRSTLVSCVNNEKSNVIGSFHVVTARRLVLNASLHPHFLPDPENGGFQKPSFLHAFENMNTTLEAMEPTLTRSTEKNFLRWTSRVAPRKAVQLPLILRLIDPYLSEDHWDMSRSKCFVTASSL